MQPTFKQVPPREPRFSMQVTYIIRIDPVSSFCLLARLLEFSSCKLGCFVN